MKITVTKIIFLALTLTLFPTATAAKGPDGVTPAEEYVCDGLAGKAYGICNAYCEAKDCDNPNHKASDNACEELYQKYQVLTGGSPPCYIPVTAAACPCFGDLTEEGFTQNTDCNTVDNGLIRDTSNGTVLQVQAVTISGLNACIGVDGQLQPISLDAANGCVSMIEDFCALP